jgi:capsid assembly protease
MPALNDLVVTLDASAITAAVLAAMPDRSVVASAAPSAAVPVWLRGGIWACDPAAIEGLAALIDAREAREHESAPRAETQFAPRGGPGTVAVIPVHGFISRRPSFWSELFGGMSLVELEAALRAAVNDPHVQAIVLDCDSPGGSVTGVHETFNAVRAANAVKPVTAVISGLCASAAYWLASGASRITLSPSAEVGSIGVFGVHADRSAFFASQGITYSVFAAPAAKAEAADVLPLTDEARAAMKRRVDEHYARFVADVAAGRHTTADAVRAGFGGGRVVGSTDAVAAGLVDAVETPDDAVAHVVDTLQDRSRRTELARLRSEVAV